MTAVILPADNRGYNTFGCCKRVMTEILFNATTTMMASTKSFTMIALLAASVRAAPPRAFVTQIPDGQVQVQWQQQSISTATVHSRGPATLQRNPASSSTISELNIPSSAVPYSSSSSLLQHAATVVRTINSQDVIETFIPLALPQYSNVSKTTVTSLNSRKSPATLVVESSVAWVPFSHIGSAPHIPAPTTAPITLETSHVSMQSQISGNEDLGSMVVSGYDEASKFSTSNGDQLDATLFSASQESYSQPTVSLLREEMSYRSQQGFQTMSSSSEPRAIAEDQVTLPEFQASVQPVGSTHSGLEVDLTTAPAISTTPRSVLSALETTSTASGNPDPDSSRTGSQAS